MTAKTKAPKGKQPDPPKANPTILLAYAGVVLNAKGTVFHVYHEVVEDWQNQGPPDRLRGFSSDPVGDSTVRWYAKRFGRATPGTVLRVEYDPAGTNVRTVYSGTATRVGQYPQDVRAQWNAESRAVEDAKAALAAVKRAERADKDDFAKRLEPLRRAYHACHTERERTVLLCRVTAIITRYRPADS